jgi:hypothetical protein
MTICHALLAAAVVLANLLGHLLEGVPMRCPIPLQRLAYLL